MKNQLYPIFLKVDQLEILIVGGGKVALEKLTFLLKSSPNARVTLVAKSFLREVLQLGEKKQVHLIQSDYQSELLNGMSVVIAATDDNELNHTVYQQAKSKQILVNVADNPPFCDFYMGGIVTKGDLKIAISTNGKSPTMAKRLRQFFEKILPEEMDELLENLNKYRKTINGDFEVKVEKLNKATKLLIE